MEQVFFCGKIFFGGKKRLSEKVLDVTRESFPRVVLVFLIGRIGIIGWNEDHLDLCSPNNRGTSKVAILRTDVHSPFDWRVPADS